MYTKMTKKEKKDYQTYPYDPKFDKYDQNNHFASIDRKFYACWVKKMQWDPQKICMEI